jgi:NAD(P)-dependent dehydrogenase (short-subunit alcohol dehydrogenase family)
MELTGKTALITGASRNIGRATALALADAGADVAVHAHRNATDIEETARLVREAGRRALVVMGDVRDGGQVRRLAKQVTDELGGVDVLVLNAAVRTESPFLEMSYEHWRAVIDLSLDGAFHLTQALLPGMLARGWGRIITLGGMSAQRGAANRAHVGAAKGAHARDRAGPHRRHRQHGRARIDRHRPRHTRGDARVRPARRRRSAGRPPGLRGGDRGRDPLPRVAQRRICNRPDD